jgi:dimethylamine monooxygenase subunit A
MGVILQRAIPPEQVEAAGMPLPRMVPLQAGDWLRVDEAYAAQLAEKARLIAERRGDVIAVLPGTEAACAELLDMVLEEVAGMAGYLLAHGRVLRPDGYVIDVDRDDPLGTLSQLVQEDFCIHEKRGEEHVLVAALLCFPAAWTLAEKIGHPLTRIHVPVELYDADIARRVQRMFDMVGEGRALWRANMLRYDDPSLFQPHTEANPRPVGRPESPYLRSERQTILRLPETGAVVFSIHTTVVERPVAAG